MSWQSALFAALIFLYGANGFSQEAPIKKNPQMSFIVVRGSYMNVHQGNGGDLSTGVLEVGYRHWFNSKIYGAFSGGVYPFSADGSESIVGVATAAYLGLNVDNIMRLEYGIDYHWWGDAMPSTVGGTVRVSVPVRFWNLNEVFGGVSFPGNSSGKTPSYILQIGVGKLF
ncbi:hypothetical protein [Bdellovibrio sp. NC01]|uniref:hypothetical protein n=1 Tax=Bdellovibrio sp. NC01 TaxID=2220073 RepID=UPI00115B6844|nr:hypothetical protein [Bdellovibrio sp. NC01]QDK36404.1 hypothetical protein DOE51_01705 [Bdellovibrio sp. NC01]